MPLFTIIIHVETIMTKYNTSSQIQIKNIKKASRTDEQKCLSEEL